LQKRFAINICLLENGAHRAFWYIPGMIRDSGVAISFYVAPYFMATRCLTTKLKTKLFQSFDKFSVGKASKLAHYVPTTSG
jgi:hypothetical protein